MTKQLAALIFLVHIVKADVGPFIDLCGDSSVPFNTATHDCIDNVVKEKEILLCVPLLKTYNNNTHKCNASNIFARNTTVQPFKCGNMNLKHRQKCCVNVVYDPRYQTCCWWKNMYRIHDHTPENKHVCCQLDAYRRNSRKAACHKSAYNDRFFKPKRLKTNQKICKESNTVFKIKVEGQTWQDDHRFLRVIVSRWLWNPFKSTRLQKTNERKRMRVDLDEYSGKRDLSGRLFLIFTDKIYPLRNVHNAFKLRFREKLYSLRRRKYLKRIIRKCRRFEANTFSSPNG